MSEHKEVQEIQKQIDGQEGEQNQSSVDAVTADAVVEELAEIAKDLTADGNVSWLSKCLQIQGFTNPDELEWLYNQVSSLPADALIVEIGVWKGRSMAAILQASKPTQTVVGIDNFRSNPEDPHCFLEAQAKDIEAIFIENMEAIGHFPNLLRGNSVELANTWFEDQSCDFIFIDGDHHRFVEDFEAWMPKMKPNGVFCGHDSGWATIHPILDLYKHTTSFDYQTIPDTVIWVQTQNS